MISSTMTWLHRHVIYPSVVRARGESDVFDALRELRALEMRGDAAQASRLQDARLREILAYARTHSAFYRSTWPAFDDRALAQPRELLATLPMIRKVDVQTRLDDLLAQPA